MVGAYHELIDKRQRTILKPPEHRELIQLTEEIERQEAKRLRHWSNSPNSVGNRCATS